LAGLLLGAFRIAGWLSRTAMIASIGLLLAYAAFVGAGASVDRATLMAVVYFGARAPDQRSSPLNALALVAALLVLADPLAVADPAFVLTFGATLAILVVVRQVGLVHVEQIRQVGQAGRVGQVMQGGLGERAATLVAGIMRVARHMFAASVAAEAL